MNTNDIKRKRPAIDSSDRIVIRLEKKQAKHLLNDIIYNDDCRIENNRPTLIEQDETLKDIKNLLIKYIIK